MLQMLPHHHNITQMGTPKDESLANLALNNKYPTTKITNLLKLLFYFCLEDTALSTFFKDRLTYFRKNIFSKTRG